MYSKLNIRNTMETLLYDVLSILDTVPEELYLKSTSEQDAEPTREKKLSQLEHEDR